MTCFRQSYSYDTVTYNIQQESNITSKVNKESQNCAFCVKSLEDGNTVKLYHTRGCDTINQTIEKRDDSIEVKEGDKVNAGGHTQTI